MTAPAWEDVKRVFGEALTLPAGERAAWLSSACGARTELRHEVESLLLAHERAGAFLDTRATGPRRLESADEDLLGQRLGPYRIEGLLGRGGMGVVYRARRESPAREVAIKVVRAAPEARVLLRFEVESAILARFDHPFIARLFDTGTTADGRPYFVMELLSGRPIEEACGALRLALRARLELFLKVCEAVSYAHGRLVVHRDVKPGNILVSDDGQPKLLDFGIARLLDPEASRATTETGLRLMTPDYASPEQVRGEPATVATDVHGLGLLLYLLLAGRAPFRLTSSSPAELVRVVCVDEAPPPSAALMGPRVEGGFEPAEAPAVLSKLLRGDLDAIVGRALRKEPEQRYASVEQLADDVRRFLDGRPVVARGGRWRYRLGKFARRQRLPLGLGLALLLALLGGLFATWQQAQVARRERERAERRFGDVRQLATRFLFDFHDAIADLPGSTQARALVLGTATEYLDGLSREAGDDAPLRVELARAYQRLGGVQGAPGRGHMGDLQAALRSLTRARAVLVDGPQPQRVDAAWERARLDVTCVLARLQAQSGRYEQSLELLERAARDAGRLLGVAHDDDSLVSAARVHYELALDLTRRHALRRAEQAMRVCLRLSLELRARRPADALNVRRLAPVHVNLADLAIRQGRYVEARAHAHEALALRRAAYRSDSVMARRGLVFALEVQARVERDGDDRAARAAHAEALDVAERLAAGDHADRQAAEDAASLASAWCAYLNRVGELRRPRDLCGEALAVFAALDQQQQEQTQFNLVSTLIDAGHERELRGDPRAALRLHQRALMPLASAVLVGGGPRVALLRAQAHVGAARARLLLGQPGEARAAAQQALAALAGEPRSDDLDALETLLAAHVLTARAEAASERASACAALAAGRAPAHTLRARTRELPRAPRVLAEFEALRAGCGEPAQP